MYSGGFMYIDWMSCLLCRNEFTVQECKDEVHLNLSFTCIYPERHILMVANAVSLMTVYSSETVPWKKCHYFYFLLFSVLVGQLGP